MKIEQNCAEFPGCEKSKILLFVEVLFKFERAGSDEQLRNYIGVIGPRPYLFLSLFYLMKTFPPNQMLLLILLIHVHVNMMGLFNSFT